MKTLTIKSKKDRYGLWFLVVLIVLGVVYAAFMIAWLMQMWHMPLEKIQFHHVLEGGALGGSFRMIVKQGKKMKIFYDMKNKIFQLLASAALLSGPTDIPESFIPEHTGTKSRKSNRAGIQMPRNKYKARKKRMVMQRESRKINRA